MAKDNNGMQAIVDQFTNLRAVTSDEDWQELLERLSAIEKPETAQDDLPDGSKMPRIGGAVTGDSRVRFGAAEEAAYNARFPDAGRLGLPPGPPLRSKPINMTTSEEKSFNERFPNTGRLK